jgi:hypothetical protein
MISKETEEACQVASTALPDPRLIELWRRYEICVRNTRIYPYLPSWPEATRVILEKASELTK